MSYKFKCLDCGYSERVSISEPEQIACPKCGGRFVDMWLLDRCKVEQPKLLTIELDSYDSVPKVFLNGAEIKKKLSIQFEWETATDKSQSIPFFKAVYGEEEKDVIVKKTVVFEDPFRDA